MSEKPDINTVMSWLEGLTEDDWENFYSDSEVQSTAKAALELLKEQRPTGKWIVCKASIHPYGYDVKCSVCGHRMGSSFGYKFCPECGADMR